MMLHSPSPRRFNYKAQYFVPSEDEDEKGIHFKRIRKTPRAEHSSPLKLLVALIILIFMFIYLQNKTPAKNQASGPFKVEEVIVVD